LAIEVQHAVESLFDIEDQPAVAWPCQEAPPKYAGDGNGQDNQACFEACA
jgi:hypothetical protein